MGKLATGIQAGGKYYPELVYNGIWIYQLYWCTNTLISTILDSNNAVYVIQMVWVIIQCYQYLEECNSDWSTLSWIKIGYLKERKENGTKMAGYITPQDSIYEKVVAEPYTRIQRKPSQLQTTQLVAEMKAHAMMFDVNYDWAGDNGLLAVIEGVAKYFARTEENYVESVKPGAQHPNILTDTAAQIRVMTVENDGQKRDYAIFSGSF